MVWYCLSLFLTSMMRSARQLWQRGELKSSLPFGTMLRQRMGLVRWRTACWCRREVLRRGQENLHCSPFAKLSSSCKLQLSRYVAACSLLGLASSPPPPALQGDGGSRLAVDLNTILTKLEESDCMASVAVTNVALEEFLRGAERRLLDVDLLETPSPRDFAEQLDADFSSLRSRSELGQGRHNVLQSTNTIARLQGLRDQAILRATEAQKLRLTQQAELLAAERRALEEAKRAAAERAEQAAAEARFARDEQHRVAEVSYALPTSQTSAHCHV